MSGTEAGKSAQATESAESGDQSVYVDFDDIEEGEEGEEAEAVTAEEDAFPLEDDSEGETSDHASAVSLQHQHKEGSTQAMQVDSPEEPRKPASKKVENEGDDELEEGEEPEEGEISEEEVPAKRADDRDVRDGRERKRPRLSVEHEQPYYGGATGDLGDFRPVYSHLAQHGRGPSPNAAGLPRSRSANDAYYSHYAPQPFSYGQPPPPMPMHAEYAGSYGAPPGPPAPYYDPRPRGPAGLPMPDYSRNDGDFHGPPPAAHASSAGQWQSGKRTGGRSQSATGKSKRQGDRSVPDVPFGRAADVSTEYASSSNSNKATGNSNSKPAKSSVPANATVIEPISTPHAQQALAALPQLPTTVTRLTAFAPGITAAVSGGRIIKTLSYTPSGEDGSSEATVKAVYKSLDAGTGQPGILPLTDEQKFASMPPKLATIFSYHMTPESASRPELFAPAADVDLSGVENLPVPVETTTHGWWPCSNTALLDKDGTAAALAKAAVDTGAPLDNRPHIEIFVDNSNILYSFLNWARRRPEAKITTYSNQVNGRTKLTKAVTLNNKKVRMDYRIFFGLLERGRKVFKRVMAASSPLWQTMAPAIEWGYEISLLQRVPRPPDAKSKPAAVIAADAQQAGANKKKGDHRSGGGREKGKGHEGEEKEAKHYKEQGVDEILHLKILETLMDYSPSTNSSQTRPVLVLATGDANSSEYNPTGFLGCVRRALALGWDVELYAFPEGLSATWAGEEARAALERENDPKKGILRIIDLEVFAEELVTI